MGWAGVVLLLTCVVFVIAVLTAIGVGFWLTAAKGQGVPDMTGGMAVLITAIIPAWGMVAQWMHTRSRERRDEIAWGQGAPPFPQSAPQQASPDELGPRPGDSP